MSNFVRPGKPRSQTAFSESSRIVTGPSLTSSTCMCAWNTPVSHRHAETANRPDKFLVEEAGLLRRSGLNIRRPAPSSRVSIQSELRDQQRGAPDVEQGEVHLARFIGKNSQIGDFLGKICRGFRIVRPADAQQHQQAGADFSGDPALHGDAGAGNTLDDGAHNDPPNAGF